MIFSSDKFFTLLLFVFSHVALLKSEAPMVIFDLSGTVADARCLSPVGPFQDTYEAEGVPITEAEARGPMGLAKKEHIRQVPIVTPDVAKRWFEAKGRSMDDADVDRMYDRYIPMQLRAIERLSNLIPGALATQQKLKDMGVQYLGGTTGFFKEAAYSFNESIRRQGFILEHVVCPYDTGGKGRPRADQKEGGYEMLLVHMKRAGITDPALVIKAGDTAGDVEEGRRIKEVYGKPTWTVGFYMTGTYFPYSKEEIEQMEPAEFAYRVADSRARLSKANFLVPSIKELPEVVSKILELNRLGVSPADYNETHQSLKGIMPR